MLEQKYEIYLNRINYLFNKKNIRVLQSIFFFLLNQLLRSGKVHRTNEIKRGISYLILFLFFRN